ncbi:hypothetical protein [Streptomyces sp. WM6372]|uniref:hypothetical protein n=1 Tax=Streptomyces sp. WM6372 TaxID=1415555 RepID=UPI00131B70D2|nr:hypothetical protein [Streptomyces sp. WM6372]
MAPLTPPPAAAPLASTAFPAAGAPTGGPSPSGPAVQRLPSFGSGSGSGSGRSIGALAAAASATVASTLEHLRPPSQQASPPGPPPTYATPPVAQGAPPPGGRPVPGSVSQEAPTPEHPAVPAGAFDPRELTDFQLDELVHRIIDRVTRLVRTELRMDRERIGRLRDPRA